MIAVSFARAIGEGRVCMLILIEEPSRQPHSAADVFDSRAIYDAERRDECITGG